MYLGVSRRVARSRERLLTANHQGIAAAIARRPTWSLDGLCVGWGVGVGDGGEVVVGRGVKFGERGVVVGASAAGGGGRWVVG